MDEQPEVLIADRDAKLGVAFAAAARARAPASSAPPCARPT
jgi:hypothetical protein